jgi:chromosome segregation ATPase
LQAADAVNDEARIKRAIEAFVALYPQHDAVSIFADFEVFRKSESFVAMKNHLASAQKELPGVQIQKQGAEDVVTQCKARLDTLYTEKNIVETIILELENELSGAEKSLNEMKHELEQLHEERKFL